VADTALGGAEEIARAAEEQIGLGDRETVAGGGERLEALEAFRILAVGG
jgi:hypothetical protein